MIYPFPEIILSKVIFHECDITRSIIMWNRHFYDLHFNHGSWNRAMKTFLLGLVDLKTCKEVPIRLSNSKLEDFLLEQGAEHIDCVFDKVAAVYVRR